jgi:AraC family transcriptional activator of pobA
VPSFSLYGEQPVAAGHIGRLHIEDIQSRSSKYLWKIGTHRHTLFSQCVLVTAGPVTVTLDEARAALSGPAVMIIPAGTVHSFRFRADTRGQVLTVDLDRLLAMTATPHRPPIGKLFAVPRAVDLGQDPALAARVELLLDRVSQEFKQPESSAAPIAGWLACSALWILSAKITSEAAPELLSSHDADRLRRFRLLIESHYARHWPVSRYARRLAVSETSLNRLCRRLAGGTAFDLIQQRLALEARRRLVYVTSPVGGIGAALGFKDPAYFSRFFRRHSGVSPNEFRRRHGGG